MENICFILVRPKVPQNVGASARAIKTMGFKELRLVGSDLHKTEPARRLAHGSDDILSNICVFGSLKEALYDCDLIVGTTARFRRYYRDYHPLDRLIKIVEKKRSAFRKLALVFGCEESGLSNEELELCDLISTIPMKTEYPSLNLSQAVMIYAYEFSRILLPRTNYRMRSAKEASQQAILKKKISEILPELGYKKGTPFYKRVMERSAMLKSIDMRIVHSLTRKILKIANKNKK